MPCVLRTSISAPCARAMLSRQRQPQAVPSAARDAIGSIEALENMRKIGLADPGAEILDADRDSTPSPRSTVTITSPPCVANISAHCPAAPETADAAPGDCPRSRCRLDRPRLLDHSNSCAVGQACAFPRKHPPTPRAHPRLQRHLYGARVAARQRQQILHQLRHPLGFARDLLERVAIGFRRRARGAAPVPQWCGSPPAACAIHATRRATNCESVFTAASSGRASCSALPSDRAISSPVAGTGKRARRFSMLMVSAACVMSCTGFSARPLSQAPPTQRDRDHHGIRLHSSSRSRSRVVLYVRLAARQLPDRTPRHSTLNCRSQHSEAATAAGDPAG